MTDWNDSVRTLDHVKRVFGDAFGSDHPSCHQWVVYRSKAKASNTEFSINRVEFVDLVTDNCFYCMARPTPTHGIDRVDNAKGYVRGNVVTCCLQCNIAKNNHNYADFESWAIRLGSNLFHWSRVTH